MGSTSRLHFILERINIPDTIILDTPEKTYMCGRAKENEIVCLSLTVSRKHCTFFFSSGELFVTDLQSANGLYINGVMQEPFKTTKLQPNDIIGVGCSNTDVLDTTKFAFKLHRIVPSQMQGNSNSDNKIHENNDNDLPQGRQSNIVHLESLSNDRFNTLSKRKREQNSSEMNTVPSKIPKLSNKELKEMSLEGDQKTTDENDIEIVHISLNNSALQQNNNTHDNAHLECAESDNKLNISKLIDTNMFKTSNDQKDPTELLKDCKVVCDKLVISREVQSLQSGWTNNDKKEEKPSIVNKNTEQLNEDDFRDEQKFNGSDLVNVKDKENIHNSCNIPFGSKKKDNHRKVKTSNEDAHSISEKSVKCSTSRPNNELNNIENGASTNHAHSSSLPPNFIQNGDTIIKLEEELQLTDNDEEAIWNCPNSVTTSLSSPIKLKQVQQKPKTKFSEVDVVNLSDGEDDIFPCSQLFDIGFGMDTSIKEEVTEEPIESVNETFNALDDADLVISLSDSEDEEEDEDGTWLRRLSQSQLLNESDETRIQKVCKTEAMDVEVINVEDPLSALSTVQDTLQSDRKEEDTKTKEEELKRFVAKNQSEEETERLIHEDENVINETKKSRNISLQDVRKENEMHLPSSSAERMNIDSEDEDFNLAELFISPIGNKKCVSITKQSSDPVESRVETHIDSSDNSTAEETSAIERRPSTSSGDTRKSHKKKIPEIEPPHLPTRRRSHSSSRPKAVSKKPAQKKPSARELKQAEKLKNYNYVKEQKNRRQLHSWADCLPLNKNKPPTSFTKEEKKKIAENRKSMLKHLADKRSSPENNEEKKRIPSKPVVKVSTKTRLDALVEDTLSASKSDDTMPKPGRSTSRSTVSNKASTNLKTGERKENKDIPKDIAACLRNSLTLADCPNLGKIPKKSNASKENANMPSRIVLEDALKKGFNVDKKPAESKSKSKTKSPTTKESSTGHGLNSTSLTGKPKKRVTFSTIIQKVHVYEIDDSNVLRKLQGKDAPLPPTKSNRNKSEITENTKVNEFLQRIFLWNPVWLEEQLRLETSPPIVKLDEIHPTLTHYQSYGQYWNVTMPLLLLETWSGITKEFQNIKDDFRRRTFMCSIVENSIQKNMPCLNIYFTSLMIEILVTKEEIEKQAHPCFGDLVFFEYVKNTEKGQSFCKVFAYVTNQYQTPLTPMTRYNKDLKTYVKNPYMLITYTMLTKYLEQNIPVNRVQRLRTVYNLRSTMRQVQALEYLPKSPVANLILNPQPDMYRLPSVSSPEPLITKDNLNPKQLEAVHRVTETIVQKQPKLCFIQGPPGTGKSKVIVNIITQVLYGNQRYVNNGYSLKILVCAPSNAAIDEITQRLLHIRSTMKQNRFRMVRIGRTEMMHPAVRDISLTQLANRHVEKMAAESTNLPLDSVKEEKSLLESKINATNYEMTNNHNLDENYRKHLQMKLEDLLTRYDLLTNRRPVGEMNPKEFHKRHRTATNTVISHADIITCTLASCYNHQMESLFIPSKRRISVCIVDEATQSCEAETLIPLMLGVNTLVLVGDPMQLPATVLSTKAKQFGLAQSIFARVQSAFELYQNNPIIMLDTQYRMQHDIASWPNKFFYNGKLKTALSPNDEFPFHSYRILNINTNQHHENNSNIDEAQFVANMIFSMLTYSNLDKWESLSIGILTPYNDQKLVISKKINEKMGFLQENIQKKIKYEVNTVDSFQGQERDVIIMSCVRSQKIGFLSDKQRLCVALTRAKHSLILCGNFNVFMKDKLWHTLLSDAQHRKVYFNVKANADPQKIQEHVVKRNRKP